MIDDVLDAFEDELAKIAAIKVPMPKAPALPSLPKLAKPPAMAKAPKGPEGPKGMNVGLKSLSKASLKPFKGYNTSVSLITSMKG